MRTNFDFSPYLRSTVGFDRLFEMLENGLFNTSENYPPFDLEQDGEDYFRITLAVAGFHQDEIEITSQQNLLTVSGRKQEQGEHNYIHRGIANRSFERRFVLGDYVQVKSANMKGGLLSIELVREIPDEMKPRHIPIGEDSALTQISDQQPQAQNENNRDQSAA